MGEGESLNEMVRSAGAYVDPGIATMTSNALMMSGEPASACAVVTGHTLIQAFAARAQAACQAFAGDSAGALAAAPELRAAEPQLAALLQSAASGQPAAGVPAGPLDGPAMVMFDLARVRPPAAALQSNDPPMIRALVADRSLPIVTRVEAGERGEASAIIEATRLSDLYVLAVRDGAAMPAAMARRARLVAAARNASNADEIMQSLVAVYGEARGSPLFATVARASASSLLTLPAKPEYANVAQEAIRGLLLLGDQRLTQTWTKLALTSVANNARAIIALDRMLPLIAVAGVDNTRRLSVGEINRWYDLMQQDDPARAPLRGYLMLELLRATGDHARGRDGAARSGAGRGAADLTAGRDPAGTAGRGGRAPPRRNRAARLDRDRRDGADRPPSRRRRRDRARHARGGRGPGGAPVRDRSRDRLRPVTRPVKKKPAPDRTREVEAFLEMLQAERGASRNTLAAYGADLDNLQVFLARRQQKPAGADTEALRAYLKSLDYVGMTPRTVARRLSVIRQFFRFLLAERMRDDDPASTLDSPKLGRPLPKVLSRAEVDRLIEATRGQGRRWRAHGDPAGDPVRHGPARVGTGDPAAVGGGARSDGADRAGQGREGPHGAAVGSCPRGDCIVAACRGRGCSMTTRPRAISSPRAGARAI